MAIFGGRAGPTCGGQATEESSAFMVRLRSPQATQSRRVGPHPDLGEIVICPVQEGTDFAIPPVSDSDERIRGDTEARHRQDDKRRQPLMSSLAAWIRGNERLMSAKAKAPPRWRRVPDSARQ
jgi:hypothetical protein